MYVKLAIFAARIVIGAIGVLWFVGLSGCEQKMADQPRYDPLEPSRLFGDGMSARPIIAGTVARGEMPQDAPFVTGRETLDTDVREAGPSLDVIADYVENFPLQVDATVVARGRQRFSIYCAPCHGADGTGTGLVVERGYPKAQSFYTDRLKQTPVGYLYDVVTRGYQNMPAFGDRIPPVDRWAIVFYVRTLQLSGGDLSDQQLNEIVNQLRTADGEVEPATQWQRPIPTDAGSGRFAVPGGEQPITD
jgi:mono/diheme cytochrome c family protein